MKDKVFVDTNLWIYHYSKEEKGKTIKNLMDEHFSSVIISTQILGELFHVLTKKELKKKEQAREIILDISKSFRIFKITPLTVNKAIDINLKHKYSYWDSLIIASALDSKCNILCSEDMQNNQLIEEKLRIINPLK